MKTNELNQEEQKNVSGGTAVSPYGTDTYSGADPSSVDSPSETPQSGTPQSGASDTNGYVPYDGSDKAPPIAYA